MKHITHRHMIAFNNALQKEAGVGSAFRFAGDALRSVSRFARSNTGKAIGRGSQELRGRYGRQLALGTGLGAAGGAAVADPDQPGGRIRGALKGALVGGGLAGGRVLATGAGRRAAKKGLGNFYQRQRYSLTGKGLGKTDKQKLQRAREIGLVDKLDPSKFPDAKKRAAETARIKLQEDALQKGYMSAPGTVHGLLTRPGDTLKSGWKRGGLMGKAFAGLGAYETAKGLYETPKPGGPGRLEKGLRGAGSAVGWMVAPTTLVGGQLVGMGGSAIGGRVGRVGDKVVQRARRPGRVVSQGGY